MQSAVGLSQEHLQHDQKDMASQQQATSAFGPKLTPTRFRAMSAFKGEADMTMIGYHFRV